MLTHPASVVAAARAIRLRMAGFLMMTFFGGGRGPLAADPLAHRQIEERDEEDAEQSRGDHPAHHARSDRDAARGAGSARDHERPHTEDDGTAGHNDRPPAQLPRRHHRVIGRFAIRPPLELDSAYPDHVLPPPPEIGRKLYKGRE